MRTLSCWLAAVALCMSCSGGTDGGDSAAPPDGDTVAGDAAAADVDAGAGDSMGTGDLPDPDAAGDSAGTEDLPPREVDETPGCVGDFCAAGPDSAPDPSTWGPFPVGVTTMSVDLFDHQGEPRTVRVEIWYPAVEEARNGPFETIDIYEDCPEKEKPFFEKFQEIVPPIKTQAVREAPVRKSDGPYPVVLFSHGAYGVRYQSVFFTIPLASHGYVVASIDHTGNTLYDIIAYGYDMDTVLLSSLDRPYDAVVSLTAVMVRNETPGDLLYQSMNTDQVGMSGHSFGGFLTLLMASLDPRIEVGVPMAPATGWLGVIGYPLEKVAIPIMMMCGLADKTLTPEQEMLPAYPKLHPPKAFLKFPTAGHYTFSDICQLDLLKLAKEANFGDAEDALKDGCGEDNIPVEIAHPIIRQFGIGIFNYYLRDSPGSLKYFDKDAAALFAEHMEYEFDFE